MWRGDEQIDSMYNSLFRELLTYMMEDPRNISFSTHLLFGSKNIERVGATVAAQTGMVGPVSTILLGVVILGEPFTPWIAFGTLCVLSGIWLLAKARPQT